jgi:hypothetical protein
LRTPPIYPPNTFNFITRTLLCVDPMGNLATLCTQREIRLKTDQNFFQPKKE